MPAQWLVGACDGSESDTLLATLEGSNVHMAVLKDVPPSLSET